MRFNYQAQHILKAFGTQWNDLKYVPVRFYGVFDEGFAYKKAGTTVYSTADAFDGGDNAALCVTAFCRYDNVVTYQTPKFADVLVTVQY